MSGLSSLLLDPEDPEMVGPTIADNITGIYAVQGVLAALLRRATSGTGGHVEVNMLEAAISFIPDAFAQYTRAGIVSARDTRIRISQAFTLAASDGGLVSIHLSSVAKFWTGLLEAIERPELADDERFATPAARPRNYPELRAILAEIFAARPRDRWAEILSAHEVPAAPVYSVAEVQADPQVVHRASFARCLHPAMGEIVSIKSPITLDGERLDQPSPPPELGADSAAISAEFGLE